MSDELVVIFEPAQPPVEVVFEDPPPEIQIVFSETGMVGPPGNSSGADVRIGNMADLTTQAQDTLVNALNEVNEPGVPLIMLYENAKAG